MNIPAPALQDSVAAALERRVAELAAARKGSTRAKAVIAEADVEFRALGGVLRVSRKKLRAFSPGALAWREVLEPLATRYRELRTRKVQVSARHSSPMSPPRGRGIRLRV